MTRVQIICQLLMVNFPSRHERLLSFIGSCFEARASLNTRRLEFERTGGRRVFAKQSPNGYQFCHFACLISFMSNLNDEYLKYLFYPYIFVSFYSVFMLNKCPNVLKVHTYDQVIHLVELRKIGGKTATEATIEATAF